MSDIKEVADTVSTVAIVGAIGFIGFIGWDIYKDIRDKNKMIQRDEKGEFDTEPERDENGRTKQPYSPGTNEKMGGEPGVPTRNPNAQDSGKTIKEELNIVKDDTNAFIGGRSVVQYDSEGGQKITATVGLGGSCSQNIDCSGSGIEGGVVSDGHKIQCISNMCAEKPPLGSLSGGDPETFIGGDFRQTYLGVGYI